MGSTLAFQKTIPSHEPTYWNPAYEGWQITVVSRGANCGTEVIPSKPGHTTGNPWRETGDLYRVVFFDSSVRGRTEDEVRTWTKIVLTTR